MDAWLGVVRWLGGLAWLWTSGLACFSAQSPLRQAQIAMDEGRLEAALSWLESQGDWSELRGEERFDFLFTFGLVSYRLDHKSDAFFYLALAREVALKEGISLKERKGELIEHILEELAPFQRGLGCVPPPSR